MSSSLEHTNNKSYHYTLFVLCFVSGIFGGLTSTLAPSYLPILSKDFATDDVEQIGAIINASFIYGMLVGGVSLGYWSDKFGRKSGIQLSTLCIGLFTLLTAFIHDWSWLVLFRFITGIGVAGSLLTSTIIISEVWTEQKKGIALGILSICFPVGIFSAGIITYNVTDWRQAFLVGALPLGLAVISQFLIYESPIWLQNKIQTVKRESLLLQKGLVSDIAIASLIYGTMLIGLWAVFVWLPTWIQSIAQGEEGQHARGISMMIFAGGGLLGGGTSGLFSKRFGMRTIMLCCFGGAFVLSVILFKLTTTLSLLTYLNMACIALFFGVSQGLLNDYIPELFPTSFRSTATGISFNVSRIFTATAVFFIGWLVHTLNGYGNALFAFSFVFLIGFVVIFFSKSGNKESAKALTK